MEDLDKILKEIYEVNAYNPDYLNKTKFKAEYPPLYGEVTQDSTDAIVDTFKDYFNENTVFYDLGCGLGKMVAHIGLQYNVKKSCGIELSEERLSAAYMIKNTYCGDNVTYIHDDIFKVDISDANVVYVDNTGMVDKLTNKIIDMLPKGCLYILRRIPFDFKGQTLTDYKFRTTYKKLEIHYSVK
jgi:SAM-dependent methyltransferase